MIIDYPQIDWLTFTTWENQIYQAWQGWQNEQEGDEKAGKIKMYSGLWRGNSFIGEGRQGEKAHGLVRVSGGDSHNAYYQLSGCGYAKCTRIDVQITTLLPAGYSARKFFDDVVEGQSEKCERDVRLIENTDGLDTVYIGSGSSNRFARFYVKLVEEVKHLRFEVEHKAEWAEAVSNSLLEDTGSLAGALLDFLGSMDFEDSQGVIKLFTDLLDGVKSGLTVPREARDKNKTLDWILEQVTPAMIRLLKDHDTGPYLAPHLQNLIDRYFLPD